MPTPSLLIVPARFKSGKLYSQIPTANGDFTVTRNTTATRFNSSGLIESVASGIPRLDYYTSGGVTGCPGLLVEPSAVNLALHSRDLTNAVWSGTNVNTAKNALGADGVASGATTLTATAASGTVLQALSHASQSRVFSAYVRRVTGTGAIQMTTNGGTNWTTVTISSLYTQVACAAQTVASGTVGFRMAVSGDVIEVDFTQGEVGPVATSPIATTAASGSRSADVVSLSSASGLIGQTEGTIYAELDFSRAIATIGIILGNGSSENFRIRKNANFSVLVQAVNTPGGTATLFTSPAASAGIYKIAFGYKNGDYAMSINGAAVLTSANSSNFPVNGFDRIFLGDTIGGVPIFNDRIRAVALYTTRLTNAELASLTA